MEYDFRNLVFEGGGMWGIAYAGALQVLSANGIYDQIERVSGSSVGAIAASLVAVGYDTDSIAEILKTTDFTSFLDRPDPLRLLTRYGYYAGDAFYKWFRHQVAESPLAGGNGAITFQELREAGGRDLYVFTTDLNTTSVTELSARATPTVALADAVRASMSIPLFFAAWKFPNDNPTDHIYVDGGIMLDFPMSVFDVPPFVAPGEPYNPQSLGLHFKVQESLPNNDLKYKEPLTYSRSIFVAPLLGQIQQFNYNAYDKQRSAIIDTLGIDPMNFSLSKEQIELLAASGARAMTKYLDDYQPPGNQDPV